MTRRPLLPLHDETSAAELLDRLAAFFTGDEPLTLRAGLLQRRGNVSPGRPLHGR